MRSDVVAVLSELESCRAHIRLLMAETKRYDSNDAVAARVDLSHADHSLDRAEGFLRRLICNGVKPWD